MGGPFHSVQGLRTGDERLRPRVGGLESGCVRE